MGALAAAVLLSGNVARAEDEAGFSTQTTVYDGARIIGTEQRAELAKELADLEQRTGWRVRVFTSYGPDNRPTDTQLRASWAPDKRTAIINFDPSNPNLTNFVHLGDEVLAKLRRPWWYEVQGRYGNMFYVRERGEAAAVSATMGVVTQCLAKEEGCRVVPGLAEDQFALCSIMAAAGGIIAGGASRLEPQGWVSSRWGWLLLFSPLWASLFINFGVGPIASRTSDIGPIAAEFAVFALAAGSPYILSSLLRAPPPAEQ